MQCTGQTPLRICSAFLVSLTEERPLKIRKGPGKNNKTLPSVRHISYDRRLARLNLFSLKKRRLRSQLIETFKILKGIENIDYRKLFTLSSNQTRSNGWKLDLKRFNTSQCGNFFTYKIASHWNKLPADVVNSASVNQFKNKLDKIIDTVLYFFYSCLLGEATRSLRHPNPFFSAMPISFSNSQLHLVYVTVQCIKLQVGYS